MTILIVWVLCSLIAGAVVFRLELRSKQILTPQKRTSAFRWALVASVPGPITLVCLIAGLFIFLLEKGLDAFFSWLDAEDMR